MQNNFPDEARRIAANAATNVTGDYYGPDDVYVVWFCYILGGWKALVSTPVKDGRYYEVTHNHEKNENYVDIYKQEVGWIHIPDNFSGELKPNPRHQQLENEIFLRSCSDEG